MERRSHGPLPAAVPSSPAAFAQPTPAGIGLRAAAGAVGGLAGGLLVSATLLLKQAATRRPSDLAQLEHKLAVPDIPALRRQSGVGLGEEIAAHGGHLALSVASTAAFGAFKSGDARPVASGLAFGLGFGALAYGGVGPALRLAPPPWRDTRADNLQHLAVHALFGIATAVVADRVARRFAP